MNDSKINFTVSYGKRLFLFLCLTVLGYVITSGISLFIIAKTGRVSTPALRILSVLQDIFLFILPALATSVIITRLPAQFLCLTKRVNVSVLLLACLGLLTAMPALNGLIAWNEGIVFPESLKHLEESLRAAEESARNSVSFLLSGDNIPSLIISILIVGVFAGLSEELFFRGAFQRLLLSNGRMNPWIGILIAAFVFSFFHFQFFGFFPRFVLGFYFGFLLFISKSLWVPVTVHALNNTLCILGEYLSRHNVISAEATSTGSESPMAITVSILLTAVVIFGILLFTGKKN